MSAASRLWVVWAAAFTSWPFLHFSAHNQSQLTRYDLQILLAVWAGTFVAAVLISILGYAVRRPHSAAQPLGAGVVLATSLFTYQWFPIGDLDTRLWLYVSLVLVLAVAVYLLAALTVMRQWLAVFTSVTILIPIGWIVYHSAKSSLAASTIPLNTSLWSGSAKRRPNVYAILIDGYAGAEALKKHTGFDNSDFLGALRDRRFIVPTSAANYPLTYLSVASTLAMDYVARPNLPPYVDRTAFYRLMKGWNPTAEGLKALGYTYAHYAEYWQGSTCAGAEDLCLRIADHHAFSETALNLLKMTPLNDLISLESVAEIAAIDRLQTALPILYRVTPFFVFAHTFAPHAPMIRNADCSRVQQLPGVDLFEFTLGGYLAQTQCVNKSVLSFADEVISRDSEAILIFFSDHGSEFLKPFSHPIENWPQEVVDERFSNFIAIRAPLECQSRLPSPMTNVNLFRFVASCLTGKDPAYLPDRFFTAALETSPEQFGFTFEIYGPAVVRRAP